jgi:predicted AAA+ superfamily ATPase
MNSYKEIVEFAEKNNLIFVVFDRNDSIFCIYLKELFPEEVQHYEKLDGDYVPFHMHKRHISIDQQLLDESFKNEKVEFIVQTVHKSDFKFVTYDNRYSGGEIDAQIYDVVFGKSLKHIQCFYDYLEKHVKSKFSSQGKIYLWDQRYGSYQPDVRNYYSKSINDLFGLEIYHKNVMDDLKRYKKHKELLIKLGESNGLNYMLYGPPGTGKSSFIRAIANELGVSLCVAKLTMALNENQVTDMLIPSKIPGLANNDAIQIVLIEDFDRYLELNEKSTMSSILNALDGIFPAFNVVRFFSANNPELINKNTALSSRMNRIMHFGLPNEDQIGNLLKNAYGDKVNNELFEKLVTELKTLKCSMRQITHYVCRYLDDDDPISSLMENKDEWIKNIQEIENYAMNIKKATKNKSNPESDKDFEDI